MSELLAEVRTVNPDLQAWAFLNRADSGGTDNRDAMQMISDTEGIELITPRIGDRKAFPNAHTQGLSVTEVKPRDRKAVTELEGLYEYCFSTKIVFNEHQNKNEWRLRKQLIRNRQANHPHLI